MKRQMTRKRVAEGMRMARATLAQIAGVFTSKTAGLDLMCSSPVKFSARGLMVWILPIAGLATSGYSAIFATHGMTANVFR